MCLLGCLLESEVVTMSQFCPCITISCLEVSKHISTCWWRPIRRRPIRPLIIWVLDNLEYPLPQYGSACLVWWSCFLCTVTIRYVGYISNLWLGIFCCGTSPAESSLSGDGILIQKCTLWVPRGSKQKGTLLVALCRQPLLSCLGYSIGHVALQHQVSLGLLIYCLFKIVFKYQYSSISVLSHITLPLEFLANCMDSNSSLESFIPFQKCEK